LRAKHDFRGESSALRDHRRSSRRPPSRRGALRKGRSSNNSGRAARPTTKTVIWAKRACAMTDFNSTRRLRGIVRRYDREKMQHRDQVPVGLRRLGSRYDHRSVDPARWPRVIPAEAGPPSGTSRAARSMQVVGAARYRDVGGPAERRHSLARNVGCGRARKKRGGASSEFLEDWDRCGRDRPVGGQRNPDRSARRLHRLTVGKPPRPLHSFRSRMDPLPAQKARNELYRPGFTPKRAASALHRSSSLS